MHRKRVGLTVFVAMQIWGLVWTVQILSAPSSLDQRLQEERQELRQLKGQLKDYQQRLERTKRREHTVLQELEESDRLLQQRGRELQTLEQHLNAQVTRHAALAREMKELTRKLHGREVLLHKRLRALYKQGSGAGAYLPFLLSASDLKDFFKRVRFIVRLVEHDANLMAQQRATLVALERTRRAVKSREEQLVQARARVAEKKQEIERERLKKNALLTKIRDEQGTYEHAMHEIEQASARLMALIAQLERQRKLALERQAREQRQRQARLQPTPDRPSAAAKRGTDAQGEFAKLKGKYPWPVAGKLVSTYGKVKHTTFNTFTFNKGVSIAAPLGSEFRVIEAGQVLYADWFKGYGNLLIVDHGDSYYSIYAHASELLVQLGDRIKRSQVVGKIGDGGSLNGPALYFEIRHHGKPENPLEWLANHQP